MDNKKNAESVNDTNDDDTESDVSDDDADDELTDDAAEPTTCLFCKREFKSVDVAMEHVDKDHKISFPQLKSKFNMDQYSFLKLINCIRSDEVDPEKLSQAEQVFWDDEKYLKPPLGYEPWLSYDYDELPVETPEEENYYKSPNSDYEQLQRLLQVLQDKIKEQATLLEQATEDMGKMRQGFQRMLEKDNDAKSAAACVLNSCSEVSLRSDDSYFGSYAHFGIHHEMLSDTVRTSSYREALFQNTTFVRGKDVLDVGCGTGVLSIFASQSGARRVVGVDNSEIIYNALDIVRNNDIENVTLIKGRLEDTALPQKMYDIIISEWMGYFLLFEGMLDSVIYARDHHLKEGGMLLPNRCTMSLVGYGSNELFNNRIAFWDNVYGLDMSNMKKEVLHEPLIDVVDPKYILTIPNVIAELDLALVDLNYSNFTYDFKLECTKAGNLSAFVGYFDTHFDLPQPIMFSTSPEEKPTHWKQVIFFMGKPRPLRVGDVVNGRLMCSRSRTNIRSLDVTIEVFGRRYMYYMD